MAYKLLKLEVLPISKLITWWLVALGLIMFICDADLCILKFSEGIFHCLVRYWRSPCHSRILKMQNTLHPFLFFFINLKCISSYFTVRAEELGSSKVSTRLEFDAVSIFHIVRLTLEDIVFRQSCFSFTVDSCLPNII